MKELWKQNLKYNIILPLVTVILFLVVWQLVGTWGLVPENFLPKPTTLAATFAEKLHDPKPEGATLLQNLISSIQISFLGFVVAVAIGVPLGLLMGYFEALDRFIKPVFEIIRPIPPIAWIPLTIVMLGIGFKAKIFIICFAAFVPCVMNAYTGVKLTNPTLIDVARACGASRMQIFIKVCVPSAIQMTFAGMQIALSASWSTLVAAEMLASSSGLGYMIQMGRLLARPDLIVLGMFIIGIIGFFLSGALTFLESRLARWRVVK